ncbi:MAG: SGNH/GDSL hydrolase family protein [Burkholderiales bacterium]|nr:SGNH/GDSL hydrolase family protein [Burkholderiales bacterium]
MSNSLGTRILGGTVLIAFGTLLALLLGEGALRLAGISFPVFEIPDPARGVALKPGKEGWYRKEGEALVRINQHGYRDAERTLAKPPGTLRIAVLGDSFVEARQVALADSFVSRLGPALAGCPALGGRPVEVLNFGVPGYATTEALLTMRQDALRFSPDWVLLALYPGNDVGENSKEVTQGGAAQWRMQKPVHVLQPDGRLVLETFPPQPLWRRALYEGIHHSRLLEVLNEARKVWEVRKMKQAAGQARDVFDLGISKDVYAAPADAAWRDAWRITEGLLAAMAREAKAGGARFAVTTVTMSEQVHPDPAVRATVEKRLGVPNLFYPEERIAEFGARHGFPVIRLAQPLQDVAARERVHLHGFKNTVMGHGHWNERGHQAAAEVIAREFCTIVSRPPASGPGPG